MPVDQSEPAEAPSHEGGAICVTEVYSLASSRPKKPALDSGAVVVVYWESGSRGRAPALVLPPIRLKSKEKKGKERKGKEYLNWLLDGWRG